MVALDDKEYAFTESMVLIVDGNSDEPIGIAGVKGGQPSSITEDTVDIIIESANFNGSSVRKTAGSLKLRTDASTRFEQGMSPLLAVFGMKAVVELIQKVAGGEIVGFSSDYALAPEEHNVSASLKNINGILGTTLSAEEVADALRRLDLSHTKKGSVFNVRVPFERLDLTIEEDIVEEIGRIVGYDKIAPSELPALEKKPEINPAFYAAEKKREELIAKGYSEVFTSVFAEEGERSVLNKVDSVKPFLRTTLEGGLAEALEKNRRNADMLGIKDVKLFEIGQVWKGAKKEETILCLADSKGVREELLAEMYRGDAPIQKYENLPLSSTTKYRPFSKYPFISRDIAMWVSARTEEENVLDMIRKNAGELLVKSYLFDRFEKGEKTSLAFRLVFQSFDRTLTDFDANERMESVSKALKEKGFEIR